MHLTARCKRAAAGSLALTALILTASGAGCASGQSQPRIEACARKKFGPPPLALATSRHHSIRTEGIAFQFDLDSGYITDVKAPCEDIESRGVGGLYFLDGETGEFKIPQEISLRSESERELVYRVATGVPDVGAEVRVVWDERAIRWRASAPAPDPSGVTAIPVVSSPSAGAKNVVLIGPPEFLIRAIGGAPEHVPIPPPGKVVVECRTVNGRQYLLIATGEGVRTEDFRGFLELLDEKYPTDPGYCVTYGRRMTRSDCGILCTALKDGPLYGWEELLDRLSEPPTDGDWRDYVRGRSVTK